MHLYAITYVREEDLLSNTDKKIDPFNKPYRMAARYTTALLRATPHQERDSPCYVLPPAKSVTRPVL